ncbi:MAG: inositol monophosphatase [Candidatus Omnitrophica bacterium]|nr:inositol monophosphatase [Candidatus Omnitrophota bacterium]
MKGFLDTARQIAVEAGNYLEKNFGQISQVIKKGDRNLATNLDREAENLIVKKIQKEFPSHGVIAEEKERFRTEADFVWIIDPLDGTHNFIRGIDVFGVSLGLWDRKQDEFVLGVVYIPKDKELYYATKGEGAYKNIERISVSEVRYMPEASGSFDSSIRYSPQVMLEALGKISVGAFNIRMFGSSVRQLTYLAEGKLDFVVEFHDRPWDFAGSVCIVKEAGGVFKSLGNEKVNPKTIGYIASNAYLYPQLKEIISEVVK